MRLLSVTLVAFFAFFEVVICESNLHGFPWSRRHNSKVNVGAAQQNTVLQKRFDGADFTYYAAGMGACGKVNKASDFIAALNAPQFDQGSYCFQTITITVNGKSTQAQITDRCAGCRYGALDLSQGLFDFFGLESQGVLQGSWVIGGAASPSTTSTPTPTPTPTPTWSSTYQPPSSTSSVTHNIASNSTSSQTPTPTSTQSSASISATPTPQETGNIADLFLIFIQFQSILTVAHHN